MSVYFIRAGAYFKIGYSDSPERRFLNLAKSSTRYTFPPGVSTALDDRELYKVIPGDKSCELTIHNALTQFDVGLEWYLDEPMLCDFIDSLSVAQEPEWGIPEVARPGGRCELEYLEVQRGRGVREEARFWAARRRAS